MSAISTPLPESTATWKQPYRGTVGMICLIIGESAIFTIFVIAYLYYIGKSLSGPLPKDVLELPIFATVCLLSSSLTIHVATKFLHSGLRRAFLIFWALTLVLGGIFLFGTAMEWHRLIYERGLTISTNLFGTTYYSLVGLHATHVIVGLTMLLVVLIFGVLGRVGKEQSARVETLALYWHFVDAVWVVVFTVVYVLGR
jgi:cytochrome c oxidase subunit III